MIEFIKKNTNKILLVVVIILSLLLIIAIKDTISYLVKMANQNNTFELGVVSSNVAEAFNGNLKSNVSINNNGNVKEYIRVFVNIYYKDSEGVILDDIPLLNTDYSLNLSSSSNWLYNNADGFYYYKTPVLPGTNTDVLINSCQELVQHTGKTLNVDIFSQAIQAEPTTAVTSSWNITIINGNIVLGGS